MTAGPECQFPEPDVQFPGKWLQRRTDGLAPRTPRLEAACPIQEPARRFGHRPRHIIRRLHRDSQKNLSAALLGDRLRLDAAWCGDISPPGSSGFPTPAG